MLVPLVLFAIAAALGVAAAQPALKGKSPPIVIALLHGAAGASGLVALAITALRPSASMLSRVSLLLFVIVALGGFILISRHLRKQALPSSIIVVHGGAAIVAFLLLALTTVGGGT